MLSSLSAKDGVERAENSGKVASEGFSSIVWSSSDVLSLASCPCCRPRGQYRQSARTSVRDAAANEAWSCRLCANASRCGAPCSITSGRQWSTSERMKGGRLAAACAFAQQQRDNIGKRRVEAFAKRS